MSIRLTASIALGGILALTACTDPGQYNTGEPDDPNRTRDGAILGGVIGAAAGLIAGDTPEERRRGVAIGAALGAGAGAIIGNQLDRQEAELRNQLGNDVRIVNTGNELIVTMPQDILFAVDSDQLRPDLQSDLRILARSLNQYPDTTVDVVGHTDWDGDAEYNQNLSTRRALSVRNVLIGAGVAPARVRAYGRGEQEPVATNLTDEGKRQNRRVEIIIRPNA